MTAMDKDDEDPGVVNPAFVKEVEEDEGVGFCKNDKGDADIISDGEVSSGNDTASIGSLDSNGSTRFHLKMSPRPLRRSRRNLPQHSPISCRSSYRSNRSSVSSVRKGILKKTNSSTTINMEMTNISQPETPTENGHNSRFEYDDACSNGDASRYTRSEGNIHLNHQRSFNRVKFILDSGRPDNVTGDYDDIKIEKIDRGFDRMDRGKLQDENGSSGLSRSGKKCLLFSAGLLILTMAVILGTFFGSRRSKNESESPLSSLVVNDQFIENAIQGRCKIIDFEFNEALYDYESSYFKTLSKELESSMLKAIFNDSYVETANSTVILRIIKYEKGSLIPLFRMKWESSDNLKNSDIRNRILKHLDKFGSLGKYRVEKSSLSISDLSNLCKRTPPQCSHVCRFSKENLRFVCGCPDQLILVNQTNCISPHSTKPEAETSVQIPSIVTDVLIKTHGKLFKIKKEKKDTPTNTTIFETPKPSTEKPKVSEAQPTDGLKVSPSVPDKEKKESKDPDEDTKKTTDLDIKDKEGPAETSSTLKPTVATSSSSTAATSPSSIAATSPSSTAATSPSSTTTPIATSSTLSDGIPTPLSTTLNISSTTETSTLTSIESSTYSSTSATEINITETKLEAISPELDIEVTVSVSAINKSVPTEIDATDTIAAKDIQKTSTNPLEDETEELITIEDIATLPPVTLKQDSEVSLMESTHSGIVPGSSVEVDNTTLEGHVTKEIKVKTKPQTSTTQEISSVSEGKQTEGVALPTEESPETTKYAEQNDITSNKEEPSTFSSLGPIIDKLTNISISQFNEPVVASHYANFSDDSISIPSVTVTTSVSTRNATHSTASVVTVFTNASSTVPSDSSTIDNEGIQQSFSTIMNDTNSITDSVGAESSNTTTLLPPTVPDAISKMNSSPFVNLTLDGGSISTTQDTALTVTHSTTTPDFDKLTHEIGSSQRTPLSITITSTSQNLIQDTQSSSNHNQILSNEGTNTPIPASNQLDTEPSIFSSSVTLPQTTPASTSVSNTAQFFTTSNSEVIATEVESTSKKVVIIEAVTINGPISEFYDVKTPNPTPTSNVEISAIPFGMIANISSELSSSHYDKENISK